MEYRITLADKDSNGISCILEAAKENNDRIVMFCHGLFSRKESASIAGLKEIFLKNSIDIFRFDMFGHGESDGKKVDICISTGLSSLTAAYEAVSSRGYKHIALVGSSYGGAVALAFASSRRGLVALALKAPAVDMASNFYTSLGKEGLKEWKDKGNYSHEGLGTLGYIFYQDALSFDLYKMAEDITVPTKIVQGMVDTSVPMFQAMKLLNSLRCEKSLEIIKSADHQFSKRADFQKMLGYISGFIIEKMKAH